MHARMHAHTHTRTHTLACIFPFLRCGVVGIDGVVSEYLRSGDADVILGTLMACYAFTKKFRMRKRDRRQAYFSFLSGIAAALNDVAAMLMASPCDEHYTALRFVIKIYHNSGLVSLPHQAV